MATIERRRRVPRVSALVVALLALATIGAPSAPAHHPESTGSISGRVTDHLGAPIGGVCVHAGNEGWTDQATGVTSPDGTYAVERLAAGSYEVRFGCYGPVSDWVHELYGVDSPTGAPVRVPVSDGQTTSGIDADLVKGASISGRLVDLTGAPVDGYVVAFQPGNVQGSGEFTNDDGTFTIRRLTPGTYKVSAFSVQPDKAVPAGDPLVLASGHSVGGLVVEATSWRSAIAGVVTDRAGAPVPNACVTARQADSPVGYPWANSRTDAGGAYRIGGMGAGQFTVVATDCAVQPARFAASYLGGADSRAGAESFTLDGRNEVVGKDIVVRPGGAVSGTVTRPSGEPVAGACVSASVSDAEDGYGTTTTDAAGRYAVGALRPGEYAVWVAPCDHLSGDFAYQRTSGVAVADGAETTGVDFTVVPPGAIEGVVRDSAGSPVAGACVFVGGPGQPHSFNNSARTDDAGRYRVERLVPGQLALFFADCAYPRDFVREYWQDAFSLESATAVAVGPGETVTGIDPVVGTGGAVTGVVRQDGRGLADACVTLEREGFGPLPSVRTAADGAYAIGLVDPGQWTARAYDCEAGRFAPQTSAPFDVVEGSTTSGIDFDVAPLPLPAPVVQGITPAAGSAAGGTVVSLVGGRLKDVTEVRFGGQPAQIATRVSRNQVDVIAPEGAVGATVDVVAVGPGGASTPNPLTRFTYADRPRLDRIDPAEGPQAGGNEVRITGRLLSDVTSVRFGDVEAAFAVQSDESLVATVPAGAEPGLVAVRAAGPDGLSDVGLQYRYLPNLPVVTGVSPAFGDLDGGDVVTISGTRLSDASAVDFGDQPSYFTVVDDTTIEAYVPAAAGPGTVPVRVTTPLGVSEATAASAYRYFGPPAVSSLSATRGPASGGGTLTITGTEFERASAVWFGGTPAPSFTVTSPTTITAEIPAGAGEVDVVVRGPGGSSTAHPGSRYEYVSAPFLRSITPNRGSVARGQATLRGDGLQHVDEVLVGQQAVAFAVQPDGSLLVEMPAHQRGNVAVSARSIGGLSPVAPVYRYVDRPVVSSITPAEGPVLGGTVSLSGLDLIDVSGVSMTEQTPVGPRTTPLRYWRQPDGTLSVGMPPHLPGAVDIAVTTAWGVSDPVQYRYKLA